MPEVAIAHVWSALSASELLRLGHSDKKIHSLRTCSIAVTFKKSIHTITENTEPGSVATKRAIRKKDNSDAHIFKL